MFRVVQLVQRVPRGVLREFGIKDEIIDSSIRISTSYENTIKEMEMLIDAIVEAKQRFKFN